jgi:hypothetical protein
LHDKEEYTCLLINVAIPDNSNVNTKEPEELSKCKDSGIEVSRLCKVETKIVPVITGALRTIKKGLVQNLQLLPGLPSATELTKITLMSTAYLICKVLEVNHFDLLLRSGLNMTAT